MGVGLWLKKSRYFSNTPTPTLSFLQKITLSEPFSVIEGIDCLYAINLATRKEKWARVSQNFAAEGLRVHRVNAIEGRELSEEDKKRLAGPYPVQMAPGHIGCLLSHLSVMQDAYTRGFRCIWILEDDVEFLRPAKKVPQLLKKLTHLDPNWDLFYTDTDLTGQEGEHWWPRKRHIKPRPDQPIKRRKYYLKRKKVTQDFMRVRSRWGMHSVLISRGGLKKILDYFTHTYLWNNIDNDIPFIPKIKMYSTTVDITRQWCQRISDTD